MLMLRPAGSALAKASIESDRPLMKVSQSWSHFALLMKIKSSLRIGN